MSCFIVDRANIECAVSLFEDYNKKFGKPDGDLNTLGNDLWVLNYKAFEDRYGQSAGRVPAFTYRRGDALRYSPIQRIKATQCLLYNAAEGKVVELPLYKKLLDVLSSAEDQFICNLPAYQAALWDLAA